MKVLVTGGAGFIGSNLTRSLLELGHQVVVLDNLLSGYRENLAEDVEWIEGDIRDAELLDRAATGCGAIFNLAASVGNKRSIDFPLDDEAINVRGFLNVLETARRQGIAKIVQSSSAGIFGELKTLPIREDHPQEPNTPYGAGKLAAEKYALAYGHLYQNLKVVCLRYFNVYGPFQRFDAYGNVIPIFVKQVLCREPITLYGDGEQTRDFVQVRDIVQANLKAAFTPQASGSFNISSATRITIRELAAQVQAAAGIEVPVQHAEPRPGDVRDSLADISAAAAAFGFAPTVGLDSGLAEYVAWMRQDPLSQARFNFS